MSSQAQKPSSTNQGLKIEETLNSITMSWNKPKNLDGFDYFEIKYRDIGLETGFLPKNTQQTKMNCITLSNLKSGTLYEVKGFIINHGESNKIFDFSCTTKLSHIPDLIRESLPTDDPKVYKLPGFVSVLKGTRVRECHLLSESKKEKKGDKRQKTILVVGATGAGKSTFIDAMVNYVVDVSFSDGCRFKMIDLTKKEKKFRHDTTVSQTSTTTCYTIPDRDGFRIDVPLNIIDTPGFDDTNGASYDEQIPIQIRQLMEGAIENLHAVCIVVPLSCIRLTNTKVFTNILKLFGANIKNIIYPCITFNDGGFPHCLQTLKKAGIPFKKYFMFNNADLNLKEPSEKSWIERNDSFKDFFREIKKTEAHSIKPSEEVLKKREQQKAKLESILTKIRIQILIANSVKHEKTIIQEYQTQIENNKNFTYQDIEYKQEKIECESQSVNCPQCEESCHKNCLVPLDIFLWFCEVFKNGKCTICRQNCDTDDHKRERFEYKTVANLVTKTSTDLKTKYNTAVEGKADHQSMIEQQQKKLKSSFDNLHIMLQNVVELIESLNADALQKTLNYTIATCLDEIIKLEEAEKDDGYSDRVQFINELKTSIAKNKSFEEHFKEWFI